MREKLFRGKRKDNGEWVYGYFIKKLDPLLLTEMCFILVQEYDTSCIDGTPTVLKSEMTWYRVIPETIGQYTGLTDINGTKIFEGDVVKVYLEIPYLPSQPKTINTVGVVEFNTEKSSYYVVSTSGEEYALCFVEQIIGNIHDNPELLKEREGKCYHE